MISEVPSDADWKRKDDHPRSAPPAWEPEVWVREPGPPAKSEREPGRPAREGRDSTRGPSRGPNPRGLSNGGSDPQPSRSGGPARQNSRSLPDDVTREVNKAVEARMAPRVAARLAEAAHAYERGRYPDALRMLTSLRRQVGGLAAVKELGGLIQYQMGHWREAIKELGDYHRMTSSLDQYPVVADCHRALRHYKVVESIWAELRQESAPAEVLTEARLVVAGSRADQGNLAGAIAVLDGVRTDLRNPKLHHLRQWYALADLYERSGEIPRARDLFARVVRFEADFYDAAERLAGLG